MPDVTFKPEFDDSDIRKALEDMGRTVKTLDSQIQKVGDAQTQAFKKAGAAANEYDEILKDVAGSTEQVEKAIEQTTQATDNAAKGSTKMGDTIENLGRRVNVLGVNLGDVIGKLRDKKSALDSVSGSSQGLNKALGVLKAGGVAAIIAAVIAAVAVFVKFGQNIDSTKSKIQNLKDQIAGWKAALIPAIETTALFAKAIGQFAIGKWSDAMNTATEATMKWNNEVLVTQKRVADLQNVIRGLANAELVNRSEAAEVARKLEELKAISADTAKSDGARLVALREYEKLQESILKSRISEAGLAISIANGQAKGTALTKEQVEAQERLTAAQIELDNLHREANATREDIARKAADEARKRQEAEAKRLREALEAYSKLVDKLGDQTDKALLSRLYDPEKLVLEREQAVKEVAAFITDLKLAAAKAGVELPATFEEDFKVIFNAIDAEFRRGLAELSEKGQKEVEKSIQAFSERISGQQLRAIAKSQEDALLSIFDKVKGKLLNSLGLSEEQADFILQSFGSVFNSIAQMNADAVNAQLEQQNRLIQASQERIVSLEQDVETERQLKKDGLASNLEDAKAALAAEQAVLEAAQNKALAIERKAANAQLVINSILQASELAVAASKVINANAGIPVAGPVIAAAGIALIFSILAQAKANAARFSQVPKLRKGKRLEGPSHEEGGVPLFVDGRHYEAEGGEWLIGSAPSKKHDTFLQKLNTGQYDNVNLLAAAEEARKNRLGTFITNYNATERKIQDLTEKQKLLLLERAYDKAADKAADKMIEYWQTRPIDTPFEKGIRRERTIGKKKVVEVIKTKA